MDKKKLIIAIMFCLVLLIIFVCIVYEHDRKPSDVVIDGTKMEGILELSGMSVFSEEYTGELESSEIRQKIQKFVKEDIPELHENIKRSNEKKLKEYYAENAKVIKNKFGIQSEAEFVDFASKINKSNINFNKWEKVEVKPESFVAKNEKDNYAYVEFDAIFENGNKMSFTLKIANKKTMTTKYILTAK